MSPSKLPYVRLRWTQGRSNVATQVGEQDWPINTFLPGAILKSDNKNQEEPQLVLAELSRPKGPTYQEEKTDLPLPNCDPQFERPINQEEEQYDIYGLIPPDNDSQFIYEEEKPYDINNHMPTFYDSLST